MYDSIYQVGLWNMRNRIRFNQEGLDHAWFTTARAAAHDFQSTFRHDKKGSEPILEKCFPPPRGTLKLNCDAPFKSKESKAGLGIVVGGWSGKAVGGVIDVCYATSPTEAEVAAIYRGLKLLEDWKIENAIIEIDPKIAVEWLLSNDIDCSYTQTG